MTETPYKDGWYWVKLPLSETQIIAQRKEGEWYLAGKEAPRSDAEVLVCSRPLRPGEAIDAVCVAADSALFRQEIERAVAEVLLRERRRVFQNDLERTVRTSLEREWREGKR